MPRDNSGNYIQPANTSAISKQTISASAFNTLETDIGSEITNSLDRQGRGSMQANLPMGGNRVTGAADPSSAQDLVTLNYLNVTFAPISSRVIAWLGYTPANKAGDTFSGSVSIASAAGSSRISINKSAPGVSSIIVGQTASSDRWALELGGQGAESGGNAGSDFTVTRYSDAGGFLGTPFGITRSSGTVTMNNGASIANGVTVSSGGINVTGASAFATSVTVPTQVYTDSTTNAASTAFVYAVKSSSDFATIGSFLNAGYSGGGALNPGATVAGNLLTAGALNAGVAYTPGAGTTWLYLGATGVGATGLWKRLT